MPQSSKSQPYSVSYHNGNYFFETDHDLAYSVGFGNITHELSPLFGIYDIDVYDIEFHALDLEPGTRKPYDKRVSATVIDLLMEQMTDRYSVLVYLCDATDGRPRERQALFTKWHRGMADVIDHEPVRIRVEDDTVYGGVFKRKDFPYSEVLKSELIDKASGFIVRKFGG